MKKLWSTKGLAINRRIEVSPEGLRVPGIEALCLNLESRLASLPTKTFKDDTAAKVMRIDFNGHRLVVKEYRGKNRLKSLCRSMRKSKAQKSWENARFLLKNNIEMVIPVAWIEDRFAFLKIKSVFISLCCTGQNARVFFNDNDKDSQAQRTAAESIIASLLMLHSKNIFVGDTKDSNIILGAKQVHWVDLDALSSPKYEWMRRKKRIRDWQVLFYNWKNNDALLNLFYTVLKSRIVSGHYWEIVHQVASYRGKKFHASEVQYRLASSFYNANEILIQAKEIACNFNHSDWEKVNSSDKAIVARRDKDGASLYCKVFLDRNWKEGLKRLFRPGRGERAVRNDQMMCAAGLPVPETLYLGSERNREYVVSQGVEGTSMMAWISRHCHDYKVKRRVLKRLGEKVAALHLAGFAHGDLRMGNVLLKSEVGEPEFVFIDNERTRLYRKLPRKLIVKNLRQINTDAVNRLSKADRLRMFKAYQKVYGYIDRESEKKLIRQVERLTEKKITARK